MNCSAYKAMLVKYFINVDTKIDYYKMLHKQIKEEIIGVCYIISHWAMVLVGAAFATGMQVLFLGIG